MIKDYPAFFDQAPTIQMQDPLARFLGAAEEGLIEYRYADAVALAGHSCPTVASAFLTTRAALRNLYAGAVAERGAIAVEWRDARSEGVTGVMANVALLITGAAGDGGFKGIGGRFRRNALMTFDAGMDADVRFTRLDNGAQVAVSAQLGKVPMAPEVRELMPLCLAGQATEEQQKTFGRAWQSRVRALLLDHADDPEVIVVHSR